MKNIVNYLISNCLSFTCVILMFSVLETVGITLFEINSHLVLDVFFLTTAVAALMFFTDQLSIKNHLFETLIRIFDVFFVVILLGGMPDTGNFLLMSLILMLTYFFVYTIMSLKYKATANAINKRIIAMKKEEGNHE